MNDRIKELAAQAGILCKPREPYDEVNLPGMMCSDNDHYKDNFLAVREFFDGGLDKFAELIVAKCVNQCEFVAGQAEITNTGEMARKTKATADNCAFWIKEYFGVEE